MTFFLFACHKIDEMINFHHRFMANKRARTLFIHEEFVFYVPLLFQEDKIFIVTRYSCKIRFLPAGWKFYENFRSMKKKMERNEFSEQIWYELKFSVIKV